MRIPKQSPLKQVRKFCLQCCGGNRANVLFCYDTKCPLWYFRLGMSPKRAINQNGKRYEQIFNPENFNIGAKFSPDKETSLFRGWK